MKKIRTDWANTQYGLVKFFRIMRLSLFLLLFFIAQGWAIESYSQKTVLNLNMSNVTVIDVLDEIENQTNFYFLFNYEQLQSDKRVDISLSNSKIEETLDQVLKGTGLNYTIKNRQIIIKKEEQHESNVSSVQQQKSVSGTVKDSSGQPLPGVSILIKGTTNGTITDFDGNFNISNVHGDATLVFSFVGMKIQEVLVAGQTAFNITMEEDAIGIEEIVAIGYGTAKKSEVTGAVGFASGEELEKQPSFNVLQKLRGKIAGVNIFTNSGSPTGENNVIIRGLGTINASSKPLYVVDGVQMSDITYMNPNNIKSIEVLKDASSAAIYGARGANGVILITTEDGAGRDGLTVDILSELSIGEMMDKPNSEFRPMNAEEFMQVQRKAFENAPVFADYTPGEEPKLLLNNNNKLFDSQGNPLYDTDWVKESTRTAVSHNHQINIHSGGEKSSTSLFLNYSDRQGILLNSYAKRANAKFVYNVKPKKWLSMGTILEVTNVWESSPDVVSGGNSVARAMEATAPIIPVKWPDGTWGQMEDVNEETNMNLLTYSNPVSILKDEERLWDRNFVFGKGYLEFHITPDLNVKSEIGFTQQLADFRYYGPTYLRQHGFPDGKANINNYNQRYWQNENYITYNKYFEKHHITVMAGASWQKSINRDNGFSTLGFSRDFHKYNYVGVSEKYRHPSSNYGDWSMNSFFGRATYNYDEKYSLTVTNRIDGSSRFGRNNKYGIFPSAGASWLVSNEDFMSGLKFIDRLRLRASYGVTGNTEIGSYGSLATISSGTTLIGGQLATTGAIARFPNANLEWEKSYQTDIGIEADLFNNTISIEIDLYDKITKDLLLGRPIPSITGFTSTIDNIGEISNKGIELKLITRNIRTSKLDWTSVLTVNYNKNKLVKLGENDEDIFPGPYWVEGSQTILRVGEPASSFWGYVREGTWALGEEDEATAVGQKVGMAKRSEHRQIIGNGIPDYRGSFINRLDIGNFDVLLDLQFSLGAEVLYQGVITSEDRFALVNGYKTQLYQSWTPENQNTMVPRIRSTQLSGQDLHIDTRLVQNASYIRGSLLSAGYTFDKSLVNSLGLDYLRLSLSVENAFLIVADDFMGYDPEATGGGGGSANFGQNIFFHQYPKPRTFTFGLNVRF